VYRVVFLLAPGLHLLDLGGPAQVFSELEALGHECAVYYVADHPEIRTAQGLVVRADTEWPELGDDDLVFVPGWHTSGTGVGGGLSAASLRRLCAHHAGGGTVASVCSGADALGRAGLLHGRRFTTHHALQDELGRRYPAGTVVRDVLFVEDSRVVTSAGIASGIDLALHLVAARHGPASRRGWPARWWCTRGATARRRRPVPCCGTARTSVTPCTISRT